MAHQIAQDKLYVALIRAYYTRDANFEISPEILPAHGEGGGSPSPVHPAGGPAQTEALWNPVIITILGVPLGFLFSSILVALNWHTMRKHCYAGLAWGFGILYCVAIQQPLLDLSQWPWPYVTGIIIWFPVLGLTQLTYLRKHRPGRYSGRPWLLPISLGIALQAAIMIWSAHDERAGQLQSTTSAPAAPPSSTELTPQQIVKALTGDVFEIDTRWRESS